MRDAMYSSFRAHVFNSVWTRACLGSPEVLENFAGVTAHASPDPMLGISTPRVFVGHKAD